MIVFLNNDDSVSVIIAGSGGCVGRGGAAGIGVDNGRIPSSIPFGIAVS